jgi:hypothetical protein
MPLYGTLDVKSWGGHAVPALSSFKPEPWTLSGVTILECRTEVAADPAMKLVPPSLHPAIPPLASITFTSVPESPVGPFKLAEVRIAARIGGRGVYFVLNSFCDNEAARTELTERWGYPVAEGEISLKDLHYMAAGTVTAGGKTVLDIRLSHREPLPGTRLNAPATLNLVRNREDGKLLLAGIPVASTYTRNDRGRQEIQVLDADACRTGGNLRPTNPLSITIGAADLTIPGIEFTVDPIEPGETSLRYVD